ncbi:MAG: DUF5309 family protein [Porcipelethomonas sp.]
MADEFATSFGTPSFSGLLFNRGNTRCPFSTMIAGNAKQTNHVEFVTGQEYETGGGTQPDISENASLTAPEATKITRSQKTNVTQIFQETVGVSYAKQSNTGTLSGINTAGQQPNPVTELDFQITARMAKIARDIEFTFMQGVYNKAKSDNEVNKTRGIMNAIQTNVLDAGGKPLRLWDIAEAMNLIYESNGETVNLVLWADTTSLFQLNADAEENGLTIVPAARDINGLQLSRIITPLGAVDIYTGQFLPEGTVGIFNPSVIGRVEQPTPGKGNFFMEELAKTGAGTKYQIFGQVGLDHGPEWYHAKITGISTEFVRPEPGRKVYITNQAVPSAEVLPVISSAVLSDSPVTGTATSALEIEYIGTPASDPVLAYQWQSGNSASGAFTDISGAESAVYTPDESDAGKYIRCKVTASGSAAGTVVTNAKKVLSA